MRHVRWIVLPSFSFSELYTVFLGSKDPNNQIELLNFGRTCVLLLLLSAYLLYSFLEEMLGSKKDQQDQQTIKRLHLPLSLISF